MGIKHVLLGSQEDLVTLELHQDLEPQCPEGLGGSTLPDIPKTDLWHPMAGDMPANVVLHSKSWMTIKTIIQM